MGYFLGLSLFAGPYLKQRHKEGHGYRMTRWIHALMRVPEESVFRANMLIVGFACAVLIHGAFNFLVTIPEIMPGNPGTLGEMFPALPAFVGRVPYLLVPSLLYVVGGFWLLTSLFMRKENMVELGHLETAEEEE
jgi:hypothetical protein